MVCEKAQDSIMLYHEKRLHPLQKLDLHKHINNCVNCKELFLAMDDLQIFDKIDKIDTLDNIEKLAEPPVDFQANVMAQISNLPTYKLDDSKWLQWGRIAMCLYSLTLAALLLIIYNTDWIPVNDFATPNLMLWIENVNLTLTNFGQTFNTFLVDNIVHLSNYLLMFGLFLSLLSVFMFQKERVFVAVANFSPFAKFSKKDSKTGKKS
ncbi:MAG: hypothetical protein FWG64_12175 [Firmicutes bacterium]|nr:hypothetical protein [Bacillota bacterium]